MYDSGVQNTVLNVGLHAHTHTVCTHWPKLSNQATYVLHFTYVLHVRSSFEDSFRGVCGYKYKLLA
jgi:hypothetical protein